MKSVEQNDSDQPRFPTFLGNLDIKYLCIIEGNRLFLRQMFRFYRCLSTRYNSKGANLVHEILNARMKNRWEIICELILLPRSVAPEKVCEKNIIFPAFTSFHSNFTHPHSKPVLPGIRTTFVLVQKGLKDHFEMVLKVVFYTRHTVCRSCIRTTYLCNYMLDFMTLGMQVFS